MRARPLLRRTLTLGLLVTALMSTFARTPVATAQNPEITISLLGQTPWTSQDDPELRVAIVASNAGQARIADLSVHVGIGGAWDSRSAYEGALIGTPPSLVSTLSFPFRGALDPGTARTFTFAFDMTTLPTVSSEDSRVYPLVVQLRSAGTTVASITSVAIHVVRTPEAPLLLSWWLELTAPPAFDVQGRLSDPSLEAQLAPSGALGAPLGAISRFSLPRTPASPIDLVVQPSLLEDVTAMADGYERTDSTQVGAGTAGAEIAAGFLSTLRGVVALDEVATVAMPFSGPLLPALLNSGLGTDLIRQHLIGRRVVTATTGVEPGLQVARPPQGALDGASIDWLARAGSPIVLADADEIDRPPQEQDFAPLPTATVTGPAGGSATLVLPDPSVDALLSRSDLLADPVRASQIVLGELALIWKEQPSPGPPTVRGVAVALPATLPPPMWRPLLERIAGAPFLSPVHPRTLVTSVNPAGGEAALRSPSTALFSLPYAQSIRDLTSDIDTYASMLVDESEQPQRMRRSLLLAESGTYVGDEDAGQPWLASVRTVTSRAFQGTVPQVDQVFTFTSREGTIPLVMGDPGPEQLSVTLQLQSSQFAFPDGNSQDVILDREGQVVSFRVVAKAAGRNPLLVRVLAPNGAEISTAPVVVRTTTANRIALLVTLTAAGILLLLYSRRWLRRPNRS